MCYVTTRKCIHQLCTTALIATNVFNINPIDYDNVTAYIDAVVPDDALNSLEGVIDVSSRDGEPSYQRIPLSRSVHVTCNPVRTKVSGSPHKHVHGESIGVFGPAEMYAFAEDIAHRLGLPLGAVLNGRVSRLDVSANFHVDHDVDDLLHLISAPPQMEEFVFRTGTKTFKNSMREITFYDKVAKLFDTGASHLIPYGWMAGRILRIEVRFIRIGKEFGRTVTVGDLCTHAFYQEAKDRWLRWVSAVKVRDGLWTVPVGGRTIPDLRDGLAAAGVVASGGEGATIKRINADRRKGKLTSAQASRQRKFIVNLMIEDSTVEFGDTIAGTFQDAMAAAAL